MRLVVFPLVALAAACLSAPAGAGEGGDPRSVVVHIFEAADADQSGTLTRAEYEGAGLQRFGVSFDQSDANADGQTSLAEYLDLYDRHHPGEGRVRM